VLRAGRESGVVADIFVAGEHRVMHGHGSVATALVASVIGEVAHDATVPQVGVS
jgi:hypothetical protein